MSLKVFSDCRNQVVIPKKKQKNNNKNWIQLARNFINFLPGIFSYLRQFRSNENVFSSNHALLEALLQSFPNFSFVHVQLGTVNVLVALLQGFLHCSCNFSWLGLPCPSKHKLIQLNTSEFNHSMPHPNPNAGISAPVLNVTLHFCIYE